jgi:hypothetical protein
MIEGIQRVESEKPSRAELEAGVRRLAAAVQEMKESAAALDAAQLRVEAALWELKTSSELAQRFLHPSSSYN